MERINELKRQVAGYLSGLPENAGVDVLTAYPGGQRRYPLRRAALTVGVESVEASPPGLGGYLGDRLDESLYGAAAVITLRFDLYAPVELGGEALDALYEMLCDSLILQPSPFRVQKVSAGTVSHDASASANHMTARATLRTALIYRDESAPIESLRVINQPAKEGTP